MKIVLDELDKKLVNLMQRGFPLARSPWAEIGLRLGISENEVLERVGHLREKRIVRIIGPVFNSRMLGYQSTLVAMRVEPGRVEESARIINRHPGVGHDYLRDHFYNLWFTLAIRGDADLKEALDELGALVRPGKMIELPSVRLFKIRLFFDLEGNGGNHDEPDDNGA
ncbi:MAG: AsnC family transcriptional regulator, partial [Dehalococcoidia bacterium]